ncbi:MAG: helix-turn-helix domain-containing protein [Myxococcota bacterium]
MEEIAVIERPGDAIAALKPHRAQLLEALTEPRSAAEVAQLFGLPRQKVRYHLQALERAGLAREAERRQWGGIVERRLVAAASTFVVSPAVLGPVGDPRRVQDRLVPSYLIALGARLVREVSELLGRARAAAKRLATLSLDTEVCFRSPEDRAAFTAELVACFNALVAKYHATEGRAHRVVLVAHPLPSHPPPSDPPPLQRKPEREEPPCL